MKKIIIIAVIAIVIISSAILFLRARAQNSQGAASLSSLQTETIEVGNLTVTISAIGTVRSSQTASLYWRTSGTVESVNAKVAQQVQAGEILATLKQTSLPKDIILAQADLVSAQQALDDLYTDAETAKVNAMQEIVQYEQAVRDAQYQLDNFTVPSNQVNLDVVEAITIMKKKLDQARAAFEPYKYYPSGDSTRQALKEALDYAQADYNAAVKRLEYVYALEVAQANLERARQEYNRWKDGPSEAEIAAAKAKIAAAQASLNQAWIEAPFAGIITLAKPQVGDQVTANTLAFKIDNLSTLFIDVEVSEIDINQIQSGQVATVTFDAIRNKVYHGEVVEAAIISEEGSSPVNYTVVVKLTDADEQVRPGMTAEVEIVTARKENVLLVPNEAIQTKDGKQVVYVIRPGQGAIPVEITLGISSETFSELLQGDLKAGDQVALNMTENISSQEQRPFMMPMFGGPPRGERPPSSSGQGTP